MAGDIAHRKAIDVIRAGSRRATPVADTPDATSPDHADRPHAELTEAVAALPTKQRQAVAYHYLAGLPYAEIATLLGSSPAAARRAAADGIATLRRTYDTESDHDTRLTSPRCIPSTTATSSACTPGWRRPPNTTTCSTSPTEPSTHP